MLLSNQRTFIDAVAIIINLITMNTLEPKGTAQNIPKSTLPHFKSSNYLQTNNNMRPSHQKIRRDRSAMSNFYAATPDKHATIDMHNKFSSKSLLETNLPEISTKHRSQKKSGFLEMWLDQALDPQQITGTTTATLTTQPKAESQRAGPLKTVQKFEIDKKYLRSQNIANETIDKLYNSLYVYTYGINNTFEEIMSLTKSNEHAQKKIINNFWKAFIKLLEGCTSYRTVFQVVEESHLKTIVDLKETFMRKQAEFYKIQSMHQEELAKLNKKINEQSYTISKVTADYNISEATLQLTDQAFNDEVNLRLKFEQKVNAMFNSYEEIRLKYQKLLSDLRMKGEEELQNRKTQVMLRAQVQQSVIRIEDLQKRVARSKEVIKEREEEIEIKRQELYQMTGRYNTLVDAKDDGEEQVRKIISKSHAYRQQNEELQCEIKIQKNHVKELEERIKKQDNIINVCRDANEKIYDKYELCGKEVGTFEGIRFELETKIIQLKEDLAIKQQRNETVEIENRELSDRKVELEQQLQLTKGDLQLKINCIEKNTEVISDLRAVKDKLEKLYTITAFEKKNMEITMNDAVRISEVFSEEMKGMKMLLESKTVELEEANHKLQNEREVFRAKINSLKEEIQAKQSQILNLHDKQLSDQEFVEKASQQRQKFAKSNEQLTGDKIKLSSENLQLRSKLQQLQRERIDNRAVMQKLNDTIEQLEKETKKNETIMNNKEFLIQAGKSNKDSENKQLRQMLESYREDRERKVSYIHPMIYEDCREQIDRLTHRVERLISQKLQNQLKLAGFEEILQQKEEIIAKLNQNLNQANQDIQKKRIQIEQLTKKAKELEHRLDRQLKERLDKEGKAKNLQLQLEKDIQAHKDTIRNLKDESHYDKSLIKKHNESISSQAETIKTLTANLKKTESDLIHQHQEAVKLREELSSQPRKTETKSVKTPAVKNRRLTSNQQDRSSLSTPKEESVRDEAHRDRNEQGARLGSIKEQMAREDELNKTANNNQFKKQKKLIEQAVQTQKPKFSHNSKFQAVNPSYSCQVNLTSEQSQQYLHQQSPQRSPREADRQHRKIQGNEFKRALKLTYMRR